MKKACISFLVITIIMMIGISFVLPKVSENKEYLRIHVRANSNEENDQAVKYKVKDEIVKYLTPYIAECDTKSKAESMINDRLSAIENVANGVLESYGFNYLSHAEIRNESFPTRVYNSLTLDGGFYDALIVELGDGKGENWWCVVYPPLCFTGQGVNYRYQSKILAIIKDFKEKRIGG